MVSDETYFQAGEAYGDAPRQSPTSFFSDPVKLATGLITDYADIRSQASLPELIGLIKGLLNPGQPLDDKKGTTELLIGILTALPSGSEVRRQLTNKFIDTLWSNLQHPPLSFVGGDVKYEVVGAEQSAVPEPKHDIIEFQVPDTGVTLREKVPQGHNGLHQYRTPDGSYNNVLEPNLGKAGSPYAKSVRSMKHLQGVKPDPGLLFDLLMARDDATFKENPGGVSAMLFYHASIIIHDLFRTSRTDMNKTDVSSYLDLAPLYGSSLKDQLEVRTMKEGKLKPDTFHEKRLLGQPPGVNVMLVLYNRMHNYVADILLKINENGRFTLACGDNASPEDRAQAIAKQDHDIFNTARLIVGGLYVNISLHDYLRAITNTHHSNSDWTLDPRVEIKQFDGEGVPRGVGNQVSAEFNLLYRFHSCISKKDERWINGFFSKLFPNQNPDDFANVSWFTLGQALQTFEQSIPPDPSVRTFDGLERQADGRFKDEDLSRILQEAMDDPAGVFGARTIPKALRIVEILGINQARKWGVASLNEFREFFGLKRWEKFTDINSDPEIASILEKLYADPDMVEMYPGLMIEDTKPLRNTGTGICPPYTLGRAVLSDAVTLVRSDRFNTIDFTASNLTNWGYNEVQADPKTMGGSMLYKLIQRGLPGWFPYNSFAVMQPMYTKKANAAIAKELGTYEKFTLDDPKPPSKPVVVFSSASIKKVLDNSKLYTLPWLKPIQDLFYGKKDLSWYMLAGDGPKNIENRKIMTKAYHKPSNLAQAIRDFVERVGSDLIKQETFKLSEGLNQIDIIRDVAIPLNARMLADIFYMDVKTDENPDGTLSVIEFYQHILNIRTWGANNTDPAVAWNRRRHAQESVNVLIDKTRNLVDEVNRNRSHGLGLISNITSAFSRKHHLKTGSLRSCGYAIVEELLAQGESVGHVTDELWLSAFGGAGVPVTGFTQVLEFFLRPDNVSLWSEVQALAQKNDYDGLTAYVNEAIRLTNTSRTMRIALGSDEIDGQQVAPGNIIILQVADAARNKNEIPDADVFNPKRTTNNVTLFSHGQHECFGKELATGMIVGLVKVAADLKQLRPAPGQMGKLKTIVVGAEKLYLNDSWSYFAADASTWKLHFDGHGQGVFAGVPTKPVEMQQYYFDLQKRKAEFMGKLAL